MKNTGNVQLHYALDTLEDEETTQEMNYSYFIYEPNAFDLFVNIILVH